MEYPERAGRHKRPVRHALLAFAVIAMASPAVAEKPPVGFRPRAATFTIHHDKWWPDHVKAIAVRAGGGAWRPVKPKGSAGPFAIAVGKSAAVMFEVRWGSRKEPIRRLAAIVPGTKYRVTGNPCAFWGLDVIDGPPADPDATERVRIDASALPASAFPIEIKGGLDDNVVLDKPGVSAPLELVVSAMCPRSGSQVIVRSGGKAIFDESLIPHPGRLHTLRLGKRGAFTLVVEP
jgi:hypothetical protein